MKNLILVMVILMIVSSQLKLFRVITAINKHTDICAQAIQQEQYQLDVITEWIKGEK